MELFLRASAHGLTGMSQETVMNRKGTSFGSQKIMYMRKNNAMLLTACVVLCWEILLRRYPLLASVLRLKNAGKLPILSLVLLSHSSKYSRKNSTRPPAVGGQACNYSEEESVVYSRIEIRVG